MKRYSYCPVCGTKLGRPVESSGRILLYTCLGCGFEFWQNSKPTAAALLEIERNGIPEVLLARRAIQPHHGMWGLPGGYLKNGEHPEDGLRREIREELGVELTKARLFTVEIGEYPRDDVAWEARFSFVLYYRCEMSPEAVPRPADDISECAWFPLDSLPSEIAFLSNRRALDSLVAARRGGTWDSSR